MKDASYRERRQKEVLKKLREATYKVLNMADNYESDTQFRTIHRDYLTRLRVWIEELGEEDAD